MGNSGVFHLEKMPRRGRAVLEAMILHYRAEMAEALLAGKAPPTRKRHEAWAEIKETPAKKAPSLGQTVLNLMHEASPRERRAMARHLMNAPLMERKLTAQEQVMMRQWVKPGSDVPMIERTMLTDQMAAIWKPRQPIKGNGPDMVDWQQGILRDLIPGRWTAQDDGRPDDAEPGEPDDSDEPGNPGGTPGTPVPPLDDLRLWIDRIACVDTTNGEAGDDEINYTGIATSGPLAEFVSPSDIGAETMAIRNAGSFGNGDSVDESVRGPIHIWPLQGRQLPDLFLVHFLMAEIDPGGGFATWRDQIFDSLAYEGPDIFLYFFVTMTWSAAGGAAIGAMGGPVGAAIGFLVGAAYGAISFMLMYGNPDDMFDLGLGFLVLEPNALSLPPFNGNPHSDQFDVEMTGDGGTYTLTYHWELTGGSAAGPGDQDPFVPG